MIRYHVSRKDDGQYQVRKEKGEKASALCSTQAEAIATAKKLSKKAPKETVVLIHAERNTVNHVKGRIRTCVSVAV